MNTLEIASEYMNTWETAYNLKGAAETSKLYTEDAVLMGYVTAIGQAQIKELLGNIIDQGWTKISIKVVNARRFGEVILAVCEYTAFGSGANEGKMLQARSSHALVNVNHKWLNTLHSAT